MPHLNMKGQRECISTLTFLMFLLRTNHYRPIVCFSENVLVNFEREVLYDTYADFWSV